MGVDVAKDRKREKGEEVGETVRGSTDRESNLLKLGFFFQAEDGIRDVRT